MYKLEDGTTVNGSDWVTVISKVNHPEVIGYGPEDEQFVIAKAEAKEEKINVQPRYLTAEELKAFSISVVEDPPPFQFTNNRFYYVGDDGSSIPKDIEGIQELLINETNNTAGSILKNTDWQIVKSVEQGKPLDPKVKAFRKSIRDYANELVGEIKALKDAHEAETWCLQPSEWPEG